MAPSSISNKMALEEAAGYMMRFQTEYRNRVTWQESLRINAGRKIIGEIRTLDSWESLPRDTYLRAIYLTDDEEPVIRWGNPDTMTSIFLGDTHEFLVCWGDELNDAKSGWIRVNKSGVISVKP